MNSKTLRTILVIILALATTLTFSACGAKDKAGDSSATPSASAGQPAGDNIELSLSMHDPVTSSNGKFYQAWADAVKEATDGHVTVTLYGSSTLASAADVGAMVESGGVDIGWVYTSFYPGQFPLTDVLTLPLSGFGDPVVGTKVLWDLYEKYPALASEWDSFKLLNLYGNPGMIFCSSGKPIDSADDLTGLMLRTPAGPITDFVTKLGASPIVMPPRTSTRECKKTTSARTYLSRPESRISNCRM